ncbi:MAG TPA: DUF2642 domain-containing protein, partial [Niallia sp.]|nr:DUF2642 domain-containing protein [Niallia sp.]
MKELSFPQALKQLIGFEVKLYLTSTRIVNGVLLDVKEDHIIVQREDKIFYFSFNQIHAIVKNAKNISPKTSFLPHESKRHLLDVLIEFKYSWITIESVNNQLFMGLLTKITEDYVMLLNEDDQIYIQRSFIVGIYNGVYEEEKIEETKEESNSNQTDNHSSIENENHTEESIQEQKDAEKEETEVLSIVNTPSSATKTPEEEIQIIDTLEHREVQSLPLTTNPSNINQVSEEAIIHVEGNAKQEESELSALVEIDNIHEKETETQAITPFNDNSSLSNNNDTSLPNSSPSSHDSTSSITTGSSETNNFTNSLKSSISDLRKLFPFSYNNQ